MLGLIIRDPVRWHDSWSSEIGRRFSIVDSTSDMFIFDKRHSRREIEAVLSDAGMGVYQFVDLQEAPSEGCDFTLDSGKCYNKLH